MADQRPICFSKPDIQREEAGTAGIRQISTRCSPSSPSAIGKATDADPERGDDGQESPVTKTPARGRGRKLFAKCQMWPTGWLIGAGELTNFSAFLCGGAENDITAMSAFPAINASVASHGLIDSRICISQQGNASPGSRPFNVSAIAESGTLREACCLWTGCRLAEFETGIRP